MIRTVVCLLLNLLIILPSYAEQAKQTKKIAITSEGKDTDASVCSKAARCQYFLIFDEEGQLKEVLDNPHRNASSGAGTMTAEYLAQEEVTFLVAGHIGYKMVDALRMNKITYLKFSGTVKKALELALEKQR